VAGRFRLYTDTDVDGPVVKALIAAGWDVLRGIDAYPEGTEDEVHFARAAQDGRVLVSNDRDMKAIAVAWFVEGQSFTGLVWWPREHYGRMTRGDFLEAFAALACQDDPFAVYPIVHLKPKR
jgi:hypothetical protein